MIYFLIAVILLFPYKRKQDTLTITYDQSADRFIVKRKSSWVGIMSTYTSKQTIGRTESLEVAKDLMAKEKEKMTG